jgi:Domain of unknown function (DUF2760)
MSVSRVVSALVPAAVVAGGNYFVMDHLLQSAGACPGCHAWLLGSPFVLGLLLAFALPRAAAPVVNVSSTPAPPPEPKEDAALRLLGILQEEGRLVDFLEEDLAPYPDDQIGAAVRDIQQKCRKALNERVSLEPVLRGVEGETVTVDAGFDPATIRLTGNVSGVPPFRGVLRHAGWRATRATLPDRSGHDPHVIAPAEVDIP